MALSGAGGAPITLPVLQLSCDGVITYVAGRGLELVRVDFGRAEDSAFLLLRVAGDAARLDPLPTQLERLPGVVWAGAPPGLRRSSPVAA